MEIGIYFEILKSLVEGQKNGNNMDWIGNEYKFLLNINIVIILSLMQTGYLRGLLMTGGWHISSLRVILPVGTGRLSK